MRSSDHRKAASVLPEPVGATTRVFSPRPMASHACTWAGVGVAKAEVNHARVTAEKPSGKSDAGGLASGVFFGLIHRFWTLPLTAAEPTMCRWMGGAWDAPGLCCCWPWPPSRAAAADIPMRLALLVLTWCQVLAVRPHNR